MYRLGKPYTAGFGLLELLSSVFLTTLLLSVLTQHFLIAKKQYKTSEKVLNQALEGQLLESLIRDSVRSAGFTPCLYLDALNGLNADSRKPLSAIHIRTEPKGNARLTMARMSSFFTVVQEIRSANQLVVDRSVEIRPGEVVLVADCYHAETHLVEAVYHFNAQYWIRLKHPLVFDYDASEVYLGEWVEESFFIQKKNAGESALFYQTEHTDHKEELLPQIHTFLARLLPMKNNLLLQIKFNSGEQKESVLETGVRAG